MSTLRVCETPSEAAAQFVRDLNAGAPPLSAGYLRDNDYANDVRAFHYGATDCLVAARGGPQRAAIDRALVGWVNTRQKLRGWTK